MHSGFESSLAAPRLLGEPAWRERQREHEKRVRAWTDPHQARAARGEKHPVYDFLFAYYSFRPAWLRRWHPGPDVILEGSGAREFLRWPEYQECTGPGADAGDRSDPTDRTDRTDRSDPTDRTDLPLPRVALALAALPPARREFVVWLQGMLTAMRDRPAFFGCFGLHEWAMVYRQTPDQVRHNAWPLRFSPAELATIVEQAPLCCTHFDAFRFFTAPARPRNKLQPTRSDALRLEQRGCLHANMDLYKWAFKLAPYSPAELIADCFELARDIREIDMRASPYDLRALGFEPIAIETEIGRGEYERWQRQFADRGEPLRLRLIALCDRLLAG